MGTRFRRNSINPGRITTNPRPQYACDRGVQCSHSRPKAGSLGIEPEKLNQRRTCAPEEVITLFGVDDSSNLRRFHHLQHFVIARIESVRWAAAGFGAAPCASFFDAIRERRSVRGSLPSPLEPNQVANLQRFLNREGESSDTILRADGGNPRSWRFATENRERNYESSVIAKCCEHCG